MATAKRFISCFEPFNDNSCFNRLCNARRSRTSRQSSSTSTTTSTELVVRIMWLKMFSFRCLTRRKNKPRDTRRSDRELQGVGRKNVGAAGYALGIKRFWRNFGFSLRVSDVVVSQRLYIFAGWNPVELTTVHSSRSFSGDRIGEEVRRGSKDHRSSAISGRQSQHIAEVGTWPEDSRSAQRECDEGEGGLLTDGEGRRPALVFLE